MKKFEGILICTDLDGTLLRKDKTVSRENLEAIEYFKENGGYFTFITGRMPYFSDKICEIVKPNVPFGCGNGGAIYDYAKREYVWKQIISDSVTELAEYAVERVPDIGVQLYTFDNIWFCRENSAMEAFRTATGVPNLVCGLREVNEPIAKIVFGDKSDENIRKLAECLSAHPRAGEFGFVRSEFTLYEILPKGINKGSIIPRLAEHLGVDMKNTIAVGDYNNDIPMIKAAGIGIAVANACEEAKAAADIITVSNEEHAIAKIISDIENGLLTRAI